uniref:Uncharacterized protein n=1 Tax=Gallus gallus TaxID=9031 RepID=A0A8V0XK59_CHICK
MIAESFSSRNFDQGTDLISTLYITAHSSIVRNRQQWSMGKRFVFCSTDSALSSQLMSAHHFTEIQPWPGSHFSPALVRSTSASHSAISVCCLRVHPAEQRSTGVFSPG